jgi:hypothetical protein
VQWNREKWFAIRRDIKEVPSRLWEGDPVEVKDVRHSDPVRSPGASCGKVHSPVEAQNLLILGPAKPDLDLTRTDIFGASGEAEDEGNPSMTGWKLARVNSIEDPEHAELSGTVHRSCIGEESKVDFHSVLLFNVRSIRRQGVRGKLTAHARGT